MQTLDRRILDRLGCAFAAAALAAFATPTIGLQGPSDALTSGASALTVALGLYMTGRYSALPRRTLAAKTRGLMLFEALFMIAILAVVMVGVLSLYRDAKKGNQEADARERFKDEIVNRGERTLDEPAAGPAVTDPGPAGLVDVTLVLQICGGLVALGLAIWGTAWGVRTLNRRRRARHEREQLAGQLSYRHAALYALARKAAKTDPLKRLFEVAGELEAVSPDDRAFVDRYLGELDKLARELKTFDKITRSRAGQAARRDFDASVERTVELLVDRRERHLETRALTFQTTADVLGQLTRGRREREPVAREESA